MPRGRPEKEPARSLNVRVAIADLEKLALLQTITGKATADVVRDAVKDYIAKNEDKLREAGQEIASGTYWQRRDKEKD